MIERGTSEGSNDGFVLIAVLSVLALLSGMIIAMLLLSRGAIDTAAITTDALRKDSMEQSALSLAAYQLFVLKRPPDAVNGQQIRLDQGVISLSVTTDAGKVDLNGSGKALLAAAYIASGLHSMSAERFAALVMDWRDEDDKPLENGAESADYTAARLKYGPRNGPFRSVDDLRWVLGLTATDIDRLRELVTIYNPRGRLDAFSASTTLISALPGVTVEMAARAAKAQTKRDDGTIAALSDILLVQSSLIDTEPPSTYRVRIEARPVGGLVQKVEVVMAAGVTPGSAYHVLHWSGD